MKRLMRNALQILGGLAILAFLIALVAITEDERRVLQSAYRKQECQEWTQIARDLGERLQTVDAGIELWKLKCIAKGLE